MSAFQLNDKVINNLDMLSIVPLTSNLGGSDSKLVVKINGEDYMLKFSDRNNREDWTSYSNNTFSEYIACHIYESVGIPVQQTYLCQYKGEIVVACKLFNEPNTTLVEINQAATHPDVRVKFSRNIDFETVYEVFKMHPNLNEKECVEAFWDTFVMDAMLANFDRHSGNLGYIMNLNTGEMKPSPVYDCASCLYPNDIQSDLFDLLKDNHAKLTEKTYSVPRSVYKYNNERVFYHEFLQSHKNRDCDEAIKRIYPKINITKINAIIDETPGISHLQKEFYKTIVIDRYERILTPAHRHLLLNDMTLKEKMNYYRDKADTPNKEQKLNKNIDRGISL